jgi:hypothetical protein
VERLACLPADMLPAWAYGVNIDWAGLMLERVSGLKLGDYMTKQ